MYDLQSVNQIELIVLSVPFNSGCWLLLISPLEITFGNRSKQNIGVLLLLVGMASAKRTNQSASQMCLFDGHTAHLPAILSNRRSGQNVSSMMDGWIAVVVVPHTLVPLNHHQQSHHSSKTQQASKPNRPLFACMHVFCPIPLLHPLPRPFMLLHPSPSTPFSSNSSNHPLGRAHQTLIFPFSISFLSFPLFLLFLPPLSSTHKLL